MSSDFDVDIFMASMEKRIKEVKDQAFKQYLIKGIDDFLDRGMTSTIFRALNLKRFPVDVEEFILSREYLDKRAEIYPNVLEELIAINNPEGDRFADCYIELLATGGIGSAKTTIALYTIAYQVLLLSCFKNPHQIFELDRASEILFVFQSITSTQAKNVSYTRFRKLIEASPYFRDNFPFDKNIESEVRFPNRIIARPIGSTSTGAIGENVIGGMIDEINHGEIVEDSKRAADGKVYNQVIENYQALSRRRKSRFLSQGQLFGIFCLVGSRLYPGQFSDIKEEEIKSEKRMNGHSSIYLYDKRSWDILPEGTFSGEMFNVFVGDNFRSPKVLRNDEVLMGDDANLVMAIPIEHYSEFAVHDIYNALREIAGVSTRAKAPFILNGDQVSASFGRTINILSRESCNFRDVNLEIYPERIVNPYLPRWVHLDLSETQDTTGIAMCHVDKFVPVEDKDSDHPTLAPNIVFDFVLEVRAPANSEIQYDRIRKLIFLLQRVGVNIAWASADQFQSFDMLQQLSQKGGITCGVVSIDKTMLPYNYLKYAFYEDRLNAPFHRVAMRELLHLEVDFEKGKIDHIATESKNCGDAMAGCVFGISRRIEIWDQFGIDIDQAPAYLKGEKLPELEYKR